MLGRSHDRRMRNGSGARDGGWTGPAEYTDGPRGRGEESCAIWARQYRLWGMLPSRVRLSLLLSTLLVVPCALGAQVRPDLPWRSIAAPPIRVHFTPELETLARRTLANAQAAYARLAAELPAPRGMVDVVVTDHVDYANGFATPFPSNRIVVHARPPVDELSLRNHEDWNLALVTHEMAHIFQLDRARGWWGVAQKLFGRAVPFFPNAYAPRWLLEGVAIHYETRFTRGGRLAGTEYPAAVRALAAESALPPLDALVLPYPYHPAGNIAYLLGASLVERAVTLDPAQGPDVAMARLVERMSSRINPWRVNASARDAVGSSFTSLYATWRDSLTRAAGDADRFRTPTDLQVRTAHGWTAAFPRFGVGDELTYVADDATRNPGLYRLRDDGTRQRIARRNTVDANAPTSAAGTVHAELDRTDPYSVRSDLYLGRGSARVRLSADGRLAHPDAHLASGRIVAVRTVPGATELVLFAPGDRSVRSIVAGSLDRTWTEPRWSRDGERIAAARWDRGGRTSIVVLDTLGRELQRFAPRAVDRPTRLAVVSSPAWLPGDTLLLFVSDHEGRPMVYRGDVRSGAYDRLWETRTALRSPDASFDGRTLAAVELRANGWAVVTRAMPSLPPLAAAAPARDAEPLPTLAAAASNDSARAQPYRAWQSARPMWWLPLFGVTDDNTLLAGAMTGGRDLVGRHVWQATLQQDVMRPEQSGSIGYAYAGRGNPVLSLGWQQDWDHFTLVDQLGDSLGGISFRSRVLSASAYLARPRVRASSYLIVGAELERSTGRIYPRALRDSLAGSPLVDTYSYPRLVTAVGASTMQRPGLSVSVEDGLAAQVTVRQRFNEGLGDASVGELIVQGSAAKSLPLPGFARHVLALRGAYGVSDARASEPFALGGVSGGSLEVLPGFAWGDPQRTFFVRGFAPSAQVGDRALSGSAEYRAPLTRVARGVGVAPVFLQKLSVLAFADVGAAWCSASPAGSDPCLSEAGRTWLASVGGELVFDASLQYDQLYRFRLGVAHPVRGIAFASQGTTVYFTLGNTF
jgi:hypothetical protein